jgi:hypothetical protein
VDERDLVPAHRVHEFFHPNNWTMFSPTDLLKLYLKEAFADAGSLHRTSASGHGSTSVAVLDATC